MHRRRAGRRAKLDRRQAAAAQVAPATVQAAHGAWLGRHARHNPATSLLLGGRALSDHAPAGRLQAGLQGVDVQIDLLRIFLGTGEGGR